VIWGPWSDWSLCPAQCDQVAIQHRSRSCKSSSKQCNGQTVVAMPCQGPPCPCNASTVCYSFKIMSCQLEFQIILIVIHIYNQNQTKIIYSVYLTFVEKSVFSFSFLGCDIQCVMGKVNDECDGCMCQDHTILGSVRSAGGLPAPGAAILRAGPRPKLLTVTDHNGHFQIPGICPDGNTTLMIKLKNHTPHQVPVPPNTERTSVLLLKLERASNASLNTLNPFDI